MIDLDAEFETLSSLAKKRSTDCINARKNQKETSETEYVCPSGDFSEANRPYTNEILAYQIAIATVFQAIDKNSLQFAQSLQCQRQKDPIIWQQTITRFTDLTTGYAAQYQKACNISFIIRLLEAKDATEVTLVQTSDTFPDYCINLANSKVNALHNLWILLASNAVWKSYQNDKDEFLTEVKWRYAKLLEKTSRYFRLMWQAVAKIDVYLKQTIK